MHLRWFVLLAMVASTTSYAEATAEGRATNMSQGRSSCAELAAQMAPSQWL